MDQAISVTKQHFPEMAHVGDITKLSGAELPPVDIITFGSPCQDVSTAGRRNGIHGERSSLFFEAIRIIREMREKTNGQYPRYALWENVPGCLSSGKPAGSDFKAVFEAFKETEIPFPRSGRWANAGMVRGGGVDLAWCVYNALDFGTSQRRRRLFLVVDFGGGCAGEILFVPKSLRGYFEAGGTPRQGPAAYSAGGAGIQTGGEKTCLNPWDTQQSRVFPEDGTSPTLAGADGGGGRNPAGLVLCATSSNSNAGFSDKEAGTLTCQHDPQYIAGMHVLNDQGGSSLSVEKQEVSPTLRSQTHGNLPIICAATGQAHAEILEDKCPTITEAAGTSGNNKPYIAMGVHQGQGGDVKTSPNAYTLTTSGSASARNAPLIMTETYGISATAINRKPQNGGNGMGIQKEISPTLTATDRHAVGGAMVHPEVSGTLCASAAGLSRPGGMASETDLCVAYCLQGNMIGRDEHSGPNGSGINEEVAFTLTATDQHSVAAVDCRNFKETGECSGTLQAKESGGYSLNSQNPVRTGYVVRRLTPVECERLQGYPDFWTAFGHDGKQISDSKRYQMLGNSIATPCAAFIMMKIAEQLNNDGKEAS